MGIYPDHISHVLIRRTADGRNTGFTLIEVLVAITLFGVIMTTLYTTFRTFLTGADALERNREAYQTIQPFFDRLTADLQNIIIDQPPRYTRPHPSAASDPYRLIVGPADTGVSGMDQIAFAATTHLSYGPEPREGISRIVYYPDEDRYGNRVIRRSDTLLPADGFQTQKTDPVICEQVAGFRVQLIDAEGEFQDTWDSEDVSVDAATPCGVRWELVLDGEAYRFTGGCTLPVYRAALEER